MDLSYYRVLVSYHGSTSAPSMSLSYSVGSGCPACTLKTGNRDGMGISTHASPPSLDRALDP